MSNQDLKNNLSQIIQLNNAIEHQKSELDKLKKKKDVIEKNLITFMESNNMTNKNLIVNNNKIKYNTTKNYETFSKKYLLEKSNIFFKDQNIANQFVDFLYNNRSIKESKSIKINIINK
jgi:hypothetical protein